MEIFFRKSEADGENLSYALDRAMAAVERAQTEYDKTAQGQGAGTGTGTGTDRLKHPVEII